MNDKLSYIDNFEKDLKNNKKEKSIIYEYIIPIVHYRRDLKETWQTIFQQFIYAKITDFPMQILLLNNNTAS